MNRIKVPSFKPNRLAKWVILAVTVLVCVLALGAGIFSHYASKKIEERLTRIGCEVGSVKVNIFTQSVLISRVDFTPGDSTNKGDSINNSPLKAQLKNIALKNVSLYRLLVNKELEIKEILVTDGSIRFSSRKSETENHRKQPKEIPINKIIIGRIVLKNLNTTLVNDSLTRCSGLLNMTLSNIQSSDTADIDNIRAYNIKDFESKITHLLYNSADGFYQTHIAAISLASNDEKLIIDSLALLPRYSKFKFSRVAGKQVDRVKTFLPRIEITGLQYNHFRDSTFLASKIVIISAEIFSFRDKRMPFKETENKPLPIAAIKQFDFGIEVDTLQLKNSKVTYEEFPPDGFKSGKIVFENLQATLVNVSNMVYQNKPRYATLEASAKIMGKGLIQASFTLPLDDNKQYHAKGKISQMSLLHLNPPLENLAFIKIESGRLNALNFDFDYNDKSANGTLTINYQDLKITGLKKEKSKDESDIKTFLINTIVKNDKDKNMPIDKRTGAIEFERDRKRQIFNFWWKSLLSGIKASVLNADKDSGKSKNSKK
jgi:Domain of Unknown Function (DUF748)